MAEVFGATYAQAYDTLYYDKNYEAECDLIHRILQTHGDGATRSILDLGCGTGNHVLPLARLGYEVVGVDRSAGMLERARAKVADLPNKDRVAFQQGDVRTVQVGRTFDVALMMFAVLGYQLENADVRAALQTVRAHLRPGGLFLFDVWYGPAVLSERPSQRIKVIPTPTGQVIRMASGDVDSSRHRCAVHFHVWQLENGRLTAETDENHGMRFFFPLELAFFLETAGLKLLRLGVFPEFDHDPSDKTWNVLGVVRAV